MFGTVDPGLFKARFATRHQIKKLLSPKNLGLCVNGRDKLSLENSFRNTWVFGSTGSGKTTCLIASTLLSDLQHSCVVLDPSGELHSLTSGYLQSQGFSIQVINLGNASRSLYFNPLAEAQTSTELKKVAHLLVSSAFPTAAQHGQNAFWYQSAEELLFVLICLLKSQSERCQNLVNVKFLLDSFGAKGKALIDFVANNATDEIYRLYKSFLAQSDNVRLSILSTAKVSLERMSDKSLAALTSKHTVDFSLLRKEKSVLFLQVPEADITYHSNLLSIIYSQLFDMAMKMPEPGEPYEPIHFLMDEFANSGIHLLDNYVNIVTSSRKRKIAITAVCQDLGQVLNLFGHDRASALLNGGAASHLFLSGQSIQTAKLISERLGTTTMTYGNFKGDTRESHRLLMTSDEITQLPADQALFFHANMPPMLLLMRPFFKNRVLSQRAALPPALLPETVHFNPIEHVTL